MKRLLRPLLLMACGAALAAPLRADYDADAAERKADWLFMEALAQKGAEHDDAHFSLMSRALELTPDKQGREAYEVGSRRMLFAHVQRDSLAFDRAMALCEGYFRAHPSDSYAGAYLARIHAERNNTDRALEIYDILQRERPNSTAITANHAELLLGDKRYDEAIELYRRLEKSMGKNAVLTQRISNIMLWKGDTLGALDVVDEYVRANPKNIDALQLAASAATEFGQTERALDYLLRARAIDPTDGNNYYYAANAYRKLGRTEDYDRTIAEAMASDDLDRASKVELARYYFSGELDTVAANPKVEAVLDTLLSQYPDDYEINMVAMSYCAGNSMWDRAADHLQAALDADSGNPDDFMTLARLLYTAERKPQAIEALERGIERHPDYPGLYELLGGLYSSAKDFDKAAATIRRGLQVESLTEMMRSDLWRDLADMAQQDSAVGSPDEFYDKALEFNPDNDLAMNNYAYYLAENGGDLLKAKELIAKAVIYNPGSSTYYDTYAWVLFRLGDLEGAKRYIDLAITSDRSIDEGDSPALAEVLLHAGDIYQALGQKDKAKDYWKRAAELKADEQVTEKANQRLSSSSSAK